MDFFGRESENDLMALLGKRRRSSARTALVYDGNLAPLIETEGYFDALIPFRQLLGL